MIERFTVPDELTCYYDRQYEPANVHIEARIPGRLDEAAVRASVRAVLASEPRLLTRRVRSRSWQRSYYWEFPVAPGADPLQTVTYADQAGLDRQRDAFLSHSPRCRACVCLAEWLLNIGLERPARRCRRTASRPARRRLPPRSRVASGHSSSRTGGHVAGSSRGSLRGTAMPQPWRATARIC